MSRKLVNNFLYGETSQAMAGRLDVQAYSQGCSELENMVCLKEGGIRRRAPLKFLLDTNYMGAKWLIPFTINSDLSFVIILTNTGMYFAKWNKTDATEQLTLLKDPNDSSEDYFISYANALKEQFTSDGETDNNLYVNSVAQETITNILDSEFKELRYANYYNSIYIVHRKHPMMRIDYDEQKENFTLALPRIVVNQDVDYKLNSADLDTGYKISDTIGYDTFSDVELNTPPKNNKCNYPSVIAIIGERMWLANTEANPDTIWVSRPFGSSQVLDKSDNHSIQDFTQFEIMEEDTQELKDTTEFPTTDKTDDNGYPVLKYDGNLNPLYRLPKKQIDMVVQTYTESVTESGVTTTSPEVYGFVVDGQLIAIQTDDVDSNGYPIYINMSGNNLYNKIAQWDTGDTDSTGKSITRDYVYGIYNDVDYSSCFLKAKYDEDGKPLTDKDGDVELTGNQIYEIYCVPLYNAYKENQLTISEPTGYWFSENKQKLNYKNWDWKAKYIYTNGTRYSNPEELDGLLIYYPMYNLEQPSALNINQGNKTTYYTTDWVQQNPTEVTNLDTCPVSEDIPAEPWSVGDSYKTYSGVTQNGRVRLYEITHTCTGSWVAGSELTKKKALETGYTLYESTAERDAAETNPYESKMCYVYKGKSWLFWNKYTRYTYQLTWDTNVTKVFKGIVDYSEIPADETKPTGSSATASSTYKTYDSSSAVDKPTWSAYETVNTYSNASPIVSQFQTDPFTGIVADDAKYTDGTIACGASSETANTYNASSSTPIYLKKEGNKVYFTWSGSKILEFTEVEKEITDASGNYNKVIWLASTNFFAIALNQTGSGYEALTPVYKNNTIYGYVNDEQEDYIEGNAYEDTDISDASQLVKYSKSLTKMATSSTGIEIQVASGRSDGVKWIGCQDSILIGTTNAEWKIPTSITALDGSASKHSIYGSDIGFFTDINTDSIFLQRNNRVRALYSDYYGLHNIDLTFTNKEIMQGKIKSIVSKQVTEPMLFFLKEDGTMTALCYDRENSVFGWSKVTFGDHKVQSIAVVENENTQSLLCLCEQTIAGSTYSYLCQFNEDFEDDESHIFKDCGYSFSVSNDTKPVNDKQYYKLVNNVYTKTTDSDFDTGYEKLASTATPEDMEHYLVEKDGEMVKVICKATTTSGVTTYKYYYESDNTEATGYTFPTDFYEFWRAFKSDITYYEIAFSNYSINYTSKMTTNAYDAQTQDGSVTIGMPKKVDKIIVRALDTGKVCTYTSNKNKNTSIYEVSEDKTGLGDFSININGGTMRDLMVTIESVDGDPMTLLALAYDVRLNNGN